MEELNDFNEEKEESTFDLKAELFKYLNNKNIDLLTSFLNECWENENSSLFSSR